VVSARRRFVVIGGIMDLPINDYELQIIIKALEKDSQWALYDRLLLVKKLKDEGKPYKKILREEYGIVA
jgi:hypothetical protein